MECFLNYETQLIKLCLYSSFTAIKQIIKLIIVKTFVSIRSTPYCKSQNNVVPLHGGIIFLILRQEYAI